MVVPFQLRAGDSAPSQQSSTTCGSASLTVARMLSDPDFARWITTGLVDARRDAADADDRTVARRFAAFEQLVAGRTNGVLGAGGRPQLPWPRALGTPPWGARGELEHGAARRGSRYAVSWFRFGGAGALERVYDVLCERVHVGRPALLYIGNAWLPRHVVLVMPSSGREGLDVYEPSVGRVVALSRASFVGRGLRLAGWDVPWAAVWPTA